MVRILADGLSAPRSPRRGSNTSALGDKTPRTYGEVERFLQTGLPEWASYPTSRQRTAALSNRLDHVNVVRALAVLDGSRRQPARSVIATAAAPARSIKDRPLPETAGQRFLEETASPLGL
jgi:hypothetical protein